MKGPGYRYDLDVRRVWRCPSCGKERKVPGDVTTVRCGCRADGDWMVLAAEAAMQPLNIAEIVARYDTPRQPREPEPAIETLPARLPEPVVETPAEPVLVEEPAMSDEPPVPPTIAAIEAETRNESASEGDEGEFGAGLLGE